MKEEIIELIKKNTTPERAKVLIEHYIDLYNGGTWITALENAGVDNWEGIDYAKELYHAWK